MIHMEHECSHKFERFMKTGITEDGVIIGAPWCPDCGAIRNEDHKWILPRYMRGDTFDIERAEEMYAEHLNELEAEIPKRAANRIDLAKELVKYIEDFTVPPFEAKNQIRRKHGIAPIRMLVTNEGEEPEGHCPNCGFAYADCECEDLLGNLDDDIEDIQARINTYIGDDILKKELKTLRGKGISIEMAKESLVAKYSQTEEEKAADGNPCQCGVEYVKQGIVWWCEGCKQNFVVQ
jgi:hypothetical protein